MPAGASEAARPGLFERKSLPAQRTLVWIPRLDVQLKQGLNAGSQIATSRITCIDERADPNRRGAAFVDELHNFARRSSGCYDVLDDEHAFVRGEFESAAESKSIVDSFREHEPRVERVCNRKSEYNGADGRRRDRVHRIRPLVGDRFSERLRQARVFEHAELLHEDIGMAPGGQPKVAVQNGAARSQHCEHLGRVHLRSPGRLPLRPPRGPALR
jgi:hypothetical protein